MYEVVKFYITQSQPLFRLVLKSDEVFLTFISEVVKKNKISKKFRPTDPSFSACVDKQTVAGQEKPHVHLAPEHEFTIK